MMDYQLTAIYHRVKEGYIAFVEEFAGANSQAATLDEVRENLREAIKMIIEANRAISGEDHGSVNVIREPINVSV